MTVAVPGGVDYSAYAGVGTEDVTAADFGIARWKIDHNEGYFVNNQNELAYTALDVILLNNVKQRVMFNPDMNAGEDDPWCKSNNHTDGYPGENFPWEGDANQGIPAYAFGYQGDGAVLPCASCNFSQWGARDPKTGKSKPPLCNELFSFTFMVLNEELEGTPGIISFKGTSISPAKKYMAPFIQRRQPLFVKSTRISLTAQMFAGRKFYVAKFDMLEDTDPTQFEEWAQIAMSAREFLTQPPLSAFPPPELADTQSAIESAPAEVAPEPTPEPVQQPTRAPVAQAATPAQARVRPTAQAAPAASQPQPSAPVQPQRPSAVTRPAAPNAAVNRPAPANQVANPTPTSAATRPVVQAPARPAAVNKPAAVSPNPQNIDNVIEGAVVDPGSIAVEGENDELPF